MNEFLRYCLEQWLPKENWVGIQKSGDFIWVAKKSKYFWANHYFMKNDHLWKWVMVRSIIYSKQWVIFIILINLALIEKSLDTFALKQVFFFLQHTPFLKLFLWFQPLNCNKICKICILCGNCITQWKFCVLPGEEGNTQEEGAETEQKPAKTKEKTSVCCSSESENERKTQEGTKTEEIPAAGKVTSVSCSSDAMKTKTSDKSQRESSASSEESINSPDKVLTATGLTETCSTGQGWWYVGNESIWARDEHLNCSNVIFLHVTNVTHLTLLDLSSQRF